ncbi:MAG: hypothetical protein CMH48_03755 [Muricauda sp.]|nr:hypothetical protein [Allomuricauda sp.]MBC29939.1 hypothetical protein [Allomuricauda sp.]
MIGIRPSMMGFRFSAEFVQPVVLNAQNFSKQGFMVAERSRSKLKRAPPFDWDPFTRTLYENEKIYFLN